jgi:hypothetical protein
VIQQETPLQQSHEQEKGQELEQEKGLEQKATVKHAVVQSQQTDLHAG